MSIEHRGEPVLNAQSRQAALELLPRRTVPRQTSPAERSTPAPEERSTPAAADVIG